MNFNKQKIFEIFITALIGALIAFLQSLLIPVPVVSDFGDSTIFASIYSGGIRALRKS